MANPEQASLKSALHALRQALPLSGYSWPLLIWPLVGVLLIISVWFYAESRLATEKREITQRSVRQVESLTDNYSDQLHRTVEQIDQLILLLKFNLENSNVILDLEALKDKGLFPNSLLMHATVIGANGNIVSSSMKEASDVSFSDTQHFQYHQFNDTDTLLISDASPSRRNGRMVVRFSRRINSSEGEFMGIAAVMVRPTYLVAFPDRSSMSDGDFISVRLVNGPVLAVQGKSADKTFFIDPPVFPAEKGTHLEQGEKFYDNEARLVSWEVDGKYPLIVLAGVTEKGVFAEYNRIASNFRIGATAGSLVIAAFTIVGMAISLRLAWRRRREEEAKETLRLATDAANEGFFAVRPVFSEEGNVTDFIYEDCNERGAQMLGSVRESIMGRRLSEILPEDYRGDIEEVFRHVLETGLHEDEVRVAKNSPVKATWIYRRIVRSGNILAVTLRDISKTKEHEHTLSRLANTDALTTLPNRHWLTCSLPEEIEQAKSGYYPLAILFIDLDNFKNINDSLGHDAGDELLVAAAFRLKSVVRASDYVVRLGGDEFTVILKHVHGIDDIAHVAQSIVRTIGEPFSLAAGAGQRVNASIGISVFPQDGEDGETLLKHADIAMYAAKAAGKGRFYFYQSHFSDTLLLKLNKEKALQEAVERDEFVIHYQPRVRVDTGTLSSMEALIRWQHPERGLVYPVEFIDVAEDNGLILRIGEIVIEKVCAQIAEWQHKNLFLVPVSINVSGVQLKQGNLSLFLANSLHRYGVSPECLEIELTESTVIEKSVVVSSELARLRAMGIRLLIDDFGTGYSSLAQLHQLDVDVLKVDHVFTAELSRDGGAEVLFRAILSMASELDMRVVAEGVETAEQLRALKKLSCYEAQGHLISQAVSALEMQAMLFKQLLFPTSALTGPSAI